MKIFIKLIVTTLILLPNSSWAEGMMPCEHVPEQITTTLSYYSKKQTPEFLKCMSDFRVCAVADGRVIKSTLIKHIPENYESTTVVIVQSPRNDDFPVCLVGAYSGGSAAAWIFEAYKIIDGKAFAFDGMERAYAQGDAIPPKHAAKMTYEMFDKYAEKLP